MYFFTLVVEDVVINVAVNVSLKEPNEISEVIPPVARTLARPAAGRRPPVESTGVTVIVAFSYGWYVALSKAIFTAESEAAETVTVTTFDVAVASATVEASITVNFAVPAAIAVTSQRIPSVEFHAAQATGVVAEPATSASAAVEATMYAWPVHGVPFASTAETETAPVLAPTASTGEATAAVIVFADLA